MDYKRLWFSAIAGLVIGFLVALVVSFFNSEIDVNGFLMLIIIIIIIGGATLSYFFLRNNTKYDEKLKNL